MQACNDGPVQSVWKFFLASVQSAKLIGFFFKNNVEGMYIGFSPARSIFRRPGPVHKIIAEALFQSS